MKTQGSKTKTRQEKLDYFKKYYKKYYYKNREEILKKSRQWKYTPSGSKYFASPEFKRKRYANYLKRRSKPGYLEYMRKLRRDWRSRIRIVCIEEYGKKCVCCGETNVAFLCLDHVNNDGYKLRKHWSWSDAYRWAYKNGFPKGILQLSCYNCNIARHYTPNKLCPHKITQTNMV